jgi:protein SCO1/2
MNRRRLIISLSSLGILLLVLLVWLVLGSSSAIKVGGPFTLTDTTGKTVTDRHFHGKYLLLYFGYTYCPDICPTTMATITDALASLGEGAKQVQPVFVTVDPARDTPAVLADYIARFSPRWQGLTGSDDHLQAMEKEYHVYAAKHVTGAGPGDYLMDHSSIVYLLDPAGKFQALIDADQPTEAVAANLKSQLK